MHLDRKNSLSMANRPQNGTYKKIYCLKTFYKSEKFFNNAVNGY